MRRTIEMSSCKNDNSAGHIYYRGKDLGWLMSYLANHFKMEYGCRYAITIVEGTKYRFIDDGEGYNIQLIDDTKLYLSFVCSRGFNKLFFTPDYNKTYDITVKKVKT